VPLPVVLVAETSCCPAVSAVVGVQLHAPAMTLAVQTCVPSTVTVTVSPVVPVPEKAGSVCVVSEPLPGVSTVKTPVSSVSTLHVCEAGVGSVRPAVFTAATWSVYVPSVRPVRVSGSVHGVKPASLISQT
jgi:hypothetical protein